MSDTSETARPEVGDPHRRLDVFVGDWSTAGTSFADGQTPDDPRASGVPWKVTSTTSGYREVSPCCTVGTQSPAPVSSKAPRSLVTMSPTAATSHVSSTMPAFILSTPRKSRATFGRSASHRRERPSPFATVANTSTTSGSGGMERTPGCRSASERLCAYDLGRLDPVRAARPSNCLPNRLRGD